MVKIKDNQVGAEFPKPLSSQQWLFIGQWLLISKSYPQMKFLWSAVPYKIALRIQAHILKCTTGKLQIKNFLALGWCSQHGGITPKTTIHASRSRWQMHSTAWQNWPQNTCSSLPVCDHCCFLTQKQVKNERQPKTEQPILQWPAKQEQKLYLKCGLKCNN